MNKAKSTHKTFSMLLAVVVLTVLIFLPRVQRQQIAASAQLTTTPVPGNDVVEFLAQIVPGTTRWSEISATLMGYGLSPYAAYNDQGQVRGYGIDISEPRLGITMPPYTQDVSAGIGVDGDMVRRIQFYFNFVNAPTPSMPEVQWANIKAVFGRLGVPSHLRIRVSDNVTGPGSNLQAYWQESGWFVTYGIGIEPVDNNGGVVSLCYTENRASGPDLGRVTPGTPLETVDVILENVPGVSTLFEPTMLLNAPEIATVRQRILNNECLKTRSDYWFVFVPEYISPTPWATDTPIPTATFTPTSTFTPTLTFTPSLTPTLPAKFDKLRLFPACSPDPATLRVWVVRNLNPFDLPFTWEVQGNREQGSGVAPANGEVTFTTHTIHPTANVVRLFVQGKLQDVSTSTSTQCPTPTPGG